jgi:hypothetical protein
MRVVIGTRDIRLASALLSSIYGAEMPALCTFGSSPSATDVQLLQTGTKGLQTVTKTTRMADRLRTC